MRLTARDVILGVSLCANLVLGFLYYRAEDRSLQRFDEPDVSVPADRNHPVAPGEMPGEMGTQRTGNTSIAEAASARVPAAASPEAIIAAQQREIEQLRKRLEVQKDPDTLFAEGAPSPQVKAEVEPILARILATDGGELPWAVECRGQICKLEVSADQATWNEAGAELQRQLQLNPEYRQKIMLRTFGRRVPNRDLITGKRYLTHEVLLQVRADTEARSLQEALMKWAMAFYKGSHVSECSARHPESGGMVAELIIPPSGPITIQTAGELSQTEIGGCLTRRMEGELSTLSVPRSETTVRWRFNLDVPDPADARK